MKQLQTTQTSLTTIRSKLKAKASKEPIFTKYESELAEMCNELAAFLTQCADAIAHVEFNGKDSDENEVKTLSTRLDGLFAAANHHTAGSQCAKRRFAQMIN